jgi:hypothetical protein
VLPEEAAGWNDAYVAAIRSYKERFRDSPDLKRLLPIVAERLYGRDIHWALELIQNAEDAGARRIVFVFEPETVHVYNDGSNFTAEDIWAICSAGHSQKKNKIGFFGIGFKSVYQLTDTPEIRSGRYALRLEDKIYPSPLLLEPSFRRQGAYFRLPVKPEKQVSLARIADELTDPEFLHLLLTLQSLQSIIVIDRIRGRKGRFFRRPVEQDPGCMSYICRIGGTWEDREEQLWRRYHFQTSEVPAGLSREGRDHTEGERSPRDSGTGCP